jgi:HSP20 family molecular chaperone IbpA
MKVSSNTPEAKQLQKLNKQQKNFVAMKKVELENLKTMYDKKANDEMLIGEDKVVQRRKQADQNIIHTIETEKERLTHVKETLNGDTLRLEKEKKILKDNHQAEMQDLGERIRSTREERFADAQNESDNLNEDVKNFTRQMSDQTNLELEQNRYEAKNHIDIASRRNDTVLRSSNDRFSKLISSTEIQNNKAVSDLLTKHEQRLKEDFTKHRTKEETQQNNHEKLVAEKDVYYSDRIKQKHEAFKRKYSAMQDSHTTLIGRIKKKFDSEIAYITGRHSEYKQNVLSKNEDQFYNVTKLKPIIEDKGDHYTISIDTNKFEKENYNLSVNDREVTLNFTRRFEEAVTDDKGSDKSARSELFSKNLTTKSILDPASISQKYNEGILTYKVSKA